MAQEHQQQPAHHWAMKEHGWAGLQGLSSPGKKSPAMTGLPISFDTEQSTFGDHSIELCPSWQSWISSAQVFEGHSGTGKLPH